MTSELRPAVEVASAVYDECREKGIRDGGALIKADREAVRAEQAAELAKFKALAETLAGALELADCALSGANMNMNVVERKVREALREYKEARDD